MFYLGTNMYILSVYNYTCMYSLLQKWIAFCTNIAEKDHMFKLQKPEKKSTVQCKEEIINWKGLGSLEQQSSVKIKVVSANKATVNFTVVMLNIVGQECVDDELLYARKDNLVSRHLRPLVVIGSGFSVTLSLTQMVLVRSLNFVLSAPG